MFRVRYIPLLTELNSTLDVIGYKHLAPSGAYVL
jgi:hypothetical protein